MDSEGKPGFPDFPPHRREVAIEVELGRGDADATVLGSDLTHEVGDMRAAAAAVAAAAAAAAA
eukprot:COSAG01_NODE_143_length_24153_cov_54.226116_29_plen_63_part_00